MIDAWFKKFKVSNFNELVILQIWRERKIFTGMEVENRNATR
jgi:hypothetical protein